MEQEIIKEIEHLEIADGKENAKKKTRRRGRKKAADKGLNSNEDTTSEKVAAPKIATINDIFKAQQRMHDNNTAGSDTPSTSIDKKKETIDKKSLRANDSKAYTKSPRKENINSNSNVQKNIPQNQAGQSPSQMKIPQNQGFNLRNNGQSPSQVKIPQNQGFNLKNNGQSPSQNQAFNLKNNGQSPSAISPMKRRPKDNKPNEPSPPTKFEPYITPEQAEAGLKDGTLVKGGVRINPRYYTDAYVSQEDSSLQDYYIGSVVDRNRALEGDEVVLKIYPKEEWNEGQIKAKVVHILSKTHPRIAVGFLTVINDKGRKVPSFQPRDKRVPHMNITLNTIPVDLFQDPKKYDGVLFTACIIDWQIPKFAIGQIMGVVGMANDIKSETVGILVENEVFFQDLPPHLGREALVGKETIPEKEYEYREDFRKECIFTIDPSTAKDLDDAVSCKRLPNGNFEIGVHIADVTYYLSEGTLLDELVTKRATSVYLVERVYHMLPIELTSTCSLLPEKDCLTFSVILEMTPDAEVVSKRFTRSVINSCCKLAYEHAQKVIDTQGTSIEKDEVDKTNKDIITNDITSEPLLLLKYDTSTFPKIGNGFTPKRIAENILTLNALAVKMRARRFGNGALRIDQMKLGFSLSSTGEPEDFFVHQSKEANRMIEEFMLLANMVVAERIYEAYPKLAFLRCHVPPVRRMLEDVKDVMECVGIFIDIDSSKGLHDSLVKYNAGDFGYSRTIVLNHLLSKPMQRATYFCTNDRDPDNFHHYALSVPFYTHFTSPIRRYADCMVHRLLSSALGYAPRPNWCPDRVAEIAKICNRQKNNAKRAGEDSCELYLAYYIDKHQPFVTDAVVIGVYEKAFDVITMRTGSVIRLYINNLDEDIQAQTECNELNGKKLWKIWFSFPADGGENSQPVVQAIDLFQIVTIALKRKPKTNKLEGQLLRPRPMIQ